MMMSFAKFVIPTTFSFICSNNFTVVQPIRLQFRKEHTSCESGYSYENNGKCVTNEGSFLESSHTVVKSPLALAAYEASLVPTQSPSGSGRSDSGSTASSSPPTPRSPLLINTPRSLYSARSPLGPLSGSSHTIVKLTPGSLSGRSAMPGAGPRSPPRSVHSGSPSSGLSPPGSGPSRIPLQTGYPLSPPRSPASPGIDARFPRRLVVNRGPTTPRRPGDIDVNAPRLEYVYTPEQMYENFHVSADPHGYAGKKYDQRDARNGFAGSPNNKWVSSGKAAPPGTGAAGEIREPVYLGEVIHAGPIPKGVPTGLRQLEGEVKLETTMCIPPGAPPLPSNQCRATSNIPNRQGPGYTTKLHSCVSVKSADEDDHLCVTQHSLNVLLDRFGSIGNVDKKGTAQIVQVTDGFKVSGEEYTTWEYTLPQFGAQPWPYINEDKQCMKCVRVGSGTETVPEK